VRSGRAFEDEGLHLSPDVRAPTISLVRQ
jgi:hypothetical protein